jgi:Flp pilus assembly protein TadG
VTSGADRGSATVEFVGVGTLVTALALGILQVGVIAHVRAVVTDSAIAGAAYAALADSTLDAGADRARVFATEGIASDLVTGVSATRTTVAGKPVAVVTMNYRIPTIGTWLPTVDSQVSGRAFLEVP